MDSVFYDSWQSGIIPCVVCALLLLWLLMSTRSTLPGPWGLPVIGSLLSLDPKSPHRSLRKMVKQYGPLFQLKLGSVSVVVLAKENLIRTVLGMEAATGRAPLYLTHGIMKGKGVIAAEGELWREHRKFMIGVMRTIGMKGGAAKTKIEAKVWKEAATVAEELGDSLRTILVDPASILLHSIGNSLNVLVFGVSYSKDDEVWQKLQYLLDEGTKLVGVCGGLNFLPWLRFLPRYKKIIKFILDNQVETHAIYQQLVDECQKKLEDGAGDGPEHYLEAYLIERNRRTLSSEPLGSFSIEQLHIILADMFGAGTETSLTTLKWVLLNLAKYQEFQDRVYEEVLEVTSDEKSEESDLPDRLQCLPFTQAFIMESQRMNPTIALGVPHGLTSDIIIRGHTVRKGTMMLPLLEEIMFSEELWENPEQFMPQRFLDPETNTIKKPTHFMPFQLGRRMCPGESYAKLLITFYTAQMLLKYKIMLPSQYTKSRKQMDASEGNVGSTMGEGSAARINQQTNIDRSQSAAHEQNSTMDKIKTFGVVRKFIEGTEQFDMELMNEVEINKDPHAEPICGFTSVPRPYKLLLIPRSSILK